ncbi:SDR family oxidoreductase [Roseiconus lacunae]|uniref:SDR family NAD(P)-dependent oxidoreductase n=1 Tax=Roseiconus lacunae TaxID=2605694 RepID=UPI003087ADE2|nr:SDR family oxidoreductase [Stieleria sp. HD01]
MPRPAARVRYDNTDRVVIVTGGSSGIGQAIAEAFVESSAQVICADVNPPPEVLADRVTYVRCDISREEECRDAIELAVQRFGGVDVLVNNAAIQPVESYRPIDELPMDVWHRMVAVNLTGYTLMAKYAIARMRRQGSGVVVNLSSGQAHRTAREVGVYGPIKSANIMQARQWAIEYAREGIRVVSVSPGAIDTPLVRASLEAQGGAGPLANRHPIGRIGKPEEVSAAVLWLSSDDASFITGTDLEVDGGLGAFGAFADPYPMSSSEGDRSGAN